MPWLAPGYTPSPMGQEVPGTTEATVPARVLGEVLLVAVCSSKVVGG